MKLFIIVTLLVALVALALAGPHPDRRHGPMPEPQDEGPAPPDPSGPPDTVKAEGFSER
ncbi:uncharacterized protein LOC120429280 [Culex pipiens pallens]|nr:uncharacterized protein LOC120429280 [Culex pipiens pallens]